MSSFNAISPDRLLRLVGVPHGPAILDVRTDEEFAADPRLIPGARRRTAGTVENWAAGFAAKSAVVVCREGGQESECVAAWLRQAGAASAEILSGGQQAWNEAKLPAVAQAKLPPRDAQGRTVWVTRARPKVDRIACAWLVRRFVDPEAVILFVAPQDVRAVAARCGGAPFDVEGEGVVWTHRGELCTFDVMTRELGLAPFSPLDRLAAIVRGADTARPDLAPEAAGLLAFSLGLSRMFDNDHAQLDAGMSLYDALFRWARDAVDERHGGESHKPRARAPEAGARRGKGGA